MKYLIYLILTLLFVASCALPKLQDPQMENENDFKIQWAEIDSLEKQGLFASALTKLDSLQIKAQEKVAKDHVVKALFYKGKYYSNLKEDAAETIIADFEKALLNETDECYQRIYHSILGELYYKYASQNQYKINQRTIVDTDEESIANWSVEKIVEKSNLHYKESVQLLDHSKLDLENYKMLITPFALRDNSFDLYSLLVIRAIQHFQNDRNLISEPVYAFRLDDNKAFGALNDFVNLNFETDDNDSYKALTVRLYQKILKYHRHSDVAERLNVERLSFISRIHHAEDKFNLYQAQLKELSSTSNYAKFAYAQSLYGQVESEKKLEAHALAKEITKAKIDKELNGKVLSFIKSLERPSLTVSIEQVYLPNEPALFQFSFNNIEEIYFSVKKVDQNILEEIRKKNNRNDQLEVIQAIPSQHDWTQAIPNSHFTQMSSELLMPSLPVGLYILLSSSKDLISYNIFQVSNLTYSTVNSNEGLDVIVADRKSGVAMENVNVNFYQPNYRNNRNNKQKVAEKKTDKDGRVKYKYKGSKPNATSISLDFEGDKLDFRDMYSQTRYGGEDNSRIYVFSDRNIYRPNQRVYVKAIALHNDNEIRRNETIEIVVTDPNGRDVYKVEKSTNNYGSVVTDFLLPNDGITGNFNVRISGKNNIYQGYLNFLVEEYKRPSFQVEVDTVVAEYKLGDSLTLTGRALMYAGPVVSNAKIEYRVTRNQFYDYDWYNYRGGLSRKGAEVDFGIITSNETGEFDFTFKLKAGTEANNYKTSVYVFNIEIKVTDISGETQFFNEQVKVSQKKIFISTNLKDEISVVDLDSVKIFSKNINDINIPFEGKLIIQSLKSPSNYKRGKYENWYGLDTTLLSDEEYQSVPFDFRMKEFKPENWEIDKEVYSEIINSPSGVHTSSVSINQKSIYYKINIINTETGEKEYEKIVKIKDVENGYVDNQNIFVYGLNRENYQPGDMLTLSLATKNRDVQLYYQLEKANKIIENKWLSLGNLPSRISVPVTENDKGGFVIHLTSFYQNRFQQEKIKVNVPHIDKELQIKLNSFKSNVEAGSEEEWSLTIVDFEGKNVTAELLASMYDSSLDALSSVHEWQNINYFIYYSRIQNLVPGYRMTNGQFLKYIEGYRNQESNPLSYYPMLNKFGYYLGNEMMMRRGGGGRVMKSNTAAPAPASMQIDAGAEAESMDAIVNSNEKEIKEIDWSQVRDVLDETVFFYPHLVTDDNGVASLKFKMSDALSSWKLQLFAHDEQGRHALESFTLKSIKELAIYPNVPRFLRVNDNLSLSGKVINSTEKELETTVTIQFINPETNEDITSQIVSSSPSYKLRIDPESSSKIKWNIDIKPQHVNGLIYRMHVGHSNGSDAIEGFIPVTTNQVLITESLPIYVKGNESKSIVFDDLVRVLESDDATLHKFSLEYSANPSWYVIQALPYLSNTSFKSTVNIVNQHIANSIGKSIASQHPEFKSTLESWARTNSEALKSNLDKNQDLKIDKIINTPWLRQSQSEAEQKQDIIKFFSENTINASLRQSLNSLLESQNNDGGFTWLTGHSNRKSNLYITSLVLESIGRMDRLNIKHDIPDNVTKRAVNYLDNELDKIYSDSLDKRITGSSHLQILYARSFFLNEKKPTNAFLILLENINKNWLDKELYEQAMIASVLNRVSGKDSALKILKSLKEQIIKTETKGAYWKLNRQYFSNHSSIDKHVMMLELFHEMGVKQAEIDELRIWLLRNKQTNHWKTIKSTSSAVYAFLLNGSETNSNWIKNSKASVILVGDEVLQTDRTGGSLYTRHDFDPLSIKSKSAKIQIKNKNEQSGWGAAYIQYFDDIKNIENSYLSELSIKKEMYKKTMSPTGPKLVSIEDHDLKPGDKLVVRLVLQNDRSLEYVHVRDERASGLEPINIKSGYKYQDALQYYQVTRDDSSNFYMSRLPRGTHIFEYELTVNLIGSFSSGMATAQCMYAPEFITHSNAIELNIE